MRRLLFVLCMFVGSLTSAQAQVSIGVGIALPGVSIGINLPAYPTLVALPGYPVYYAPRANSNYFFYDGMYWVYQRDNWYASSWYNGPWWLVDVEEVPLFILRVPVRYYLQPPLYFQGWRRDAPPRWGERWGNDWDQRHSGWDRWDRRAAPRPAPLPVYQRQYSGSRYPRAEQQPVLQGRNYRYEPREPVVRQHYQTQRVAPAVPATSPPGRRAEPQGGVSNPRDQGGSRRDAPVPAAPREERSSREREGVPRPPTSQPRAPQERSAEPPQNRQPQQQSMPQREQREQREPREQREQREQPVRPAPPAAAPREPQGRPAQQPVAPHGQPPRGEDKDRDKDPQRGGSRNN